LTAPGEKKVESPRASADGEEDLAKTQRERKPSTDDADGGIAKKKISRKGAKARRKKREKEERGGKKRSKLGGRVA
jgi:hypothetical protein